MTEPTPLTPQTQPAPLPERVQAVLAAEFFDKPAPVDRCGECSFDQTTTILHRYTNGTARWVSFCPSCYSRADLGSADVSDRLAARALLAEMASALAAAQEREDALREALGWYADHRNYFDGRPGMDRSDWRGVVEWDNDQGERARDAL